ncbi:sulfite exporter TauE/SafE family protein [Methanobrevibacter filiformis]|uniref:Probable membrane transporter protein n=1 Tax=Methanobrevibacter filiformis TaxID=55758 RepID=A0A166F823_9EURY|nr:TSUP family transporter [Methanobrevibacter filiformis]KZX17414.1 sulfite exporter TauE/SafE [Methanobrevibacter filiformis]
MFLILIGIFVGISSGLLGVGGGFLMVPLQFFLLSSIGIESDTALMISLGTSLAVIIPTSISSIYKHNKFSDYTNYSVKIGIILGIFGILGGFLGGLLSTHIQGDLIKTLLGFCLIGISLILISDKLYKNNADRSLNTFSINFNEFDINCNNFNNSNIYLMAFLGFLGVLGVLVGLSSGMFGIGGGLFIIPILIFIFKFSMKESTAISSIFISLTAIGSLIPYLLSNQVTNIPLVFGYVYLINFIVIAIFSIPFSQVGTILSNKINETPLRRIFAILMIYMGLRLLDFDIIQIIFNLIAI